MYFWENSNKIQLYIVATTFSGCFAVQVTPTSRDFLCMHTESLHAQATERKDIYPLSLVYSNPYTVTANSNAAC